MVPDSASCSGGELQQVTQAARCISHLTHWCMHRETLNPECLTVCLSQDPGQPSEELLRSMGIYRKINAAEIAQALIREGKTGWKYDWWKSPKENLWKLHLRYSMNRHRSFSFEVWEVSRAGSWGYQASLTSCILKEPIVGRTSPTEESARMAAADAFFATPEAQDLTVGGSAAYCVVVSRLVLGDFSCASHGCIVPLFSH